MKITFTATEKITLQQCLECQSVGLEIYVDEGYIVTVEDTEIE